ncbi:MAG: hypothetical protein ABI780_06010 [Ardenticatenales bacterium]
MKNVKVMWDGLNAWKTDGHPLEPAAAGGGAGASSPGAGITVVAPAISTVVPAPPAP